MHPRPLPSPFGSALAGPPAAHARCSGPLPAAHWRWRPSRKRPAMWWPWLTIGVGRQGSRGPLGGKPWRGRMGQGLVAGWANRGEAMCRGRLEGGDRHHGTVGLRRGLRGCLRAAFEMIKA
ncbi:hypothetical protein BT67DRAFT_286474 [Trichocladium antarcticum]|uniref:Uncharacterized protein n=1 Tax=Trichocladium antarcticum TaxID=1450529 RepID=A0AAN6UKY3_9PEZI|nr:hypothetical protein BT67DRAFT_286474 [Trichocladium antarcticum]